MPSKKTNVDLVSDEFDRRMTRFDLGVLRGRSMTPAQVESTIARMQASFDRTVRSLKECSAAHRRPTLVKG